MFKRKLTVKVEPGLKRQTLESDHTGKENSQELENHDHPATVLKDSKSIPRIDDKYDSEDSDTTCLNEDRDDIADTEIEDEADESFEAGVILGVDVQDFMCHKKFTINFGRMFNFVTGLNGAGKSAIVAAIQLCMGAAARKSGRGTNIRSLIRDGSPGPAIVSVTLLNEGCDAYSPEKYGNRIKIERRLAKTGAGGYALLNSAGKVVSRERAELDRILQNFNIYVDNPCCILTQEQSKTFINGAASEKYKFFLKATGLEMISEEVDNCMEMLETAKEDEGVAKEKVRSKYDAVQAVEKELALLDSLEKYEADIRLSAAKLYWVDVAEATEVLRKLEVKHEDNERAVEKAERAVEGAILKRDGHGTIEEASKVLEELVEQQKVLDREMDEVHKRLKRATLHENDAKNAQRLAAQSLRDHEKRTREVAKEIADIQATEAKNAEESTRMIMNEMARCSNTLLELEDRQNMLSEEVKRAQQTVDSIDTDIRQCENVKHMAEGAISNQQRQLSAMSRGSRSRISMFGGERLEEVLNRIKRENFRSQVLGPLGVHITLKPDFKQFGAAIEKALFKTLFCFLVDNPEDRNKLVGILKHAGVYNQHPIIIQQPSSRFEIRSFPNLTVMAQAVTVEEDIVFNALVDQCRIDQIVLVNDERESDRITETRNGRAAFPPGITSAMTVQGSTIIYRNGNKSSEMLRFPPKQLLAADTSDVIAHLQAEIDTAMQEISDAMRTAQQYRGKKVEAERARRDVEDQIRKVNHDISVIRRQKSALQSQLSDIEAAEKADVRLLTLEAELQDLRLACESVQKSLGEVNEKLAECVEVSRAVDAEKKSREDLKRELSARFSEQENLLENHINLLAAASRDIEKKSKLLDLSKKTVQEHVKTIDRQKEIVAKKTEEANQHMPEYLSDWDGQPVPLEHTDTRDSLEKKIIKLTAQVQKSKERAGLENFSRPFLNERHRKLALDYQEYSETYKVIRRRIKELTADSIRRKEGWTDQVLRYSKLVSNNFDKYMQKKGFSGKVTFNHGARTLTITSQTDNQSLLTKCDDMRQMSGGERSYTTLCLLMALGHVVECPFRLMDEYDVYLDQISREITLKEIQKYALGKEQRGRQFIVITPQSLDSIVTTQEVRVHRLRTPGRNTARGPRQTVIDDAL